MDQEEINFLSKDALLFSYVEEDSSVLAENPTAPKTTIPPPLSLENIHEAPDPTALWTRTQLNQFFNNEVDELIDTVNKKRIILKYEETNVPISPSKMGLPLTSRSIRSVDDPRAYWPVTELNNFIETKSDMIIEDLEKLRKKLVVVENSGSSQSEDVEMEEMREDEVQCAKTAMEQLSIQDHFSTNQG